MKKRAFLSALGVLLSVSFLGLNASAATEDPVATLPTRPATMTEQLSLVTAEGHPERYPVKLSPNTGANECAWQPVEYDSSGNVVNWMSTYGNDVNQYWKEYISSRSNVVAYPQFENFYKEKTGNKLAFWESEITELVMPDADSYAVEEPTYKQHRYTRYLGYHQDLGEWVLEPIPVQKWELAHPTGMCIHNAIDDAYGYAGYGQGEYKGSGDICGRPYYSGWRAYCAYCGQPVSQDNGYLMYMTADTASKINVIDAGRGYMYVCPYTDCKHLEQATRGMQHECVANSQNRYRVVYRTGDYNDIDDNTFQEFIVDTKVNADGSTRAQYEGVSYPDANTALFTNEQLLSSDKFANYRNTVKQGYVITGFKVVDQHNHELGSWQVTDNYGTKTNHLATFDVGEILYSISKTSNLCTNDYDGWKNADGKSGVIYLMAIWEPMEATLVIDANGGRYTDSGSYAGMTLVTDAGSKYVINSYSGKTYWVNSKESDATKTGSLIPPSSKYTVTFDCDYDVKGGRYTVIGSQKYERKSGSYLPSLYSLQTFDGWTEGKLSQSYVDGKNYVPQMNQGAKEIGISAVTKEMLSWTGSDYISNSMNGVTTYSKGTATKASPIYRFTGEVNNYVDVLTANWKYEEITLPNAYWEHTVTDDDGVERNVKEECIGWYRSTSFSSDSFYGIPGDVVIPSGDVTLYAKFGTLTLEAKENYTANNKKGAADLVWNESFNGNYYYSIICRWFRCNRQCKCGTESRRCSQKIKGIRWREKAIILSWEALPFDPN